MYSRTHVIPQTQNFPALRLATGIATYTPAVLRHNERGYYIEYFVRHPDSGQSVRFRQNANMLRKRLSAAEFKSTIHVQVANLNAKLAAGWTPFAADGNGLRFTPLHDALPSFVKAKQRELRPATLTSYKSQIDILLRYLDQIGLQGVTIGNFSKPIAYGFLDYLSLDRDLADKPKKPLSNNAWNTYLKKYSAIFGFFVERGYITENPFAGIRTKPKEDKKRQNVTPEQRTAILSYLQQHNPGYIMVLALIYSSLIRPKEIELIRIQDVDLDKHWVHIPADNAKTHKERYAPLTEEECTILRTWGLHNYPPTYYLIGSSYRPDHQKAYHGKYKKDWITIRRKLALPSCVQLYSFKDTGLSDMILSGVDVLTAMRAADHHDLSVTTRYVCHADTDMINKVRAHAPTLTA